MRWCAWKGIENQKRRRHDYIVKYYIVKYYGYISNQFLRRVIHIRMGYKLNLYVESYLPFCNMYLMVNA